MKVPFDEVAVVPVYILFQAFPELLIAMERVFLSVEHLDLQLPKEILHDRIVQAVSLPRHGLSHAKISNRVLHHLNQSKCQHL